MGKHDVAELTPKAIGQSVPRREDPGILTGHVAYIADIVLPNMLHVAFLRSPLPHARITRIDTVAARAVTGVELVWTGSDVSGLSPGIVGSMQLEGFVTTAQPIIANDIVRFVGECVAVVVARSRRIAEDALQLIEVDYEELPAVTDAEKALIEPALANEAVPANLVYRSSRVDDDLSAAAASAAVIVSGRFQNNRVSASPLETRGCVAQYDWSSGQMTFWTSTQMPSFVRTMLSIFLAFPEHLIEVRTPHVGGGFGQKAHLHPEELAVCLLAKTVSRPVSWIEDRQENLLSATHAKHQLNEMELTAAADGTLLSIRNRSVTDGGAYNCLPWTQLVESHIGSAVLTGVYKIGLASDESLSVATNKCPIGAYRGVGWTAGQIAREGLIDRAARALGLSPFEIRRRNVVRAADFPYTNRTGLVIREGTFLETLNLLEKMVDYDLFRRRQRAEAAKGRYLGLGISIFHEINGVGTRALNHLRTPVTTHDTATVRVDPTGKVTVTTPLVSAGQGLATTLAQVAADAFGVTVDDVTIRSGSTANAYGFGTFASRGAVIGAGTIGRAAQIVRDRIRQHAAGLLEASPEDIVLSNGMVHIAGVPAKGMPLAAVAGAIYFADATHPQGFDPALEATAAYDPADLILANGGHAAIVELDAETGVVRVEKVFAVEDCGRMINPMIVEGQIRGGIAQAIGSGLLEEIVYDSTGQLLTTTLMDYLLPTSMDVPDIQIAHLETPSSLVPGGIKGMGESAMISAPAAVVGAVNDALAAFGVVVETLPITPERVFQAIAGARKNP
jgi:carbon-monoxide dehydrogenase large subunit